MDINSNYFTLDLGVNNFKVALINYNTNQIELKNLGILPISYNLYSTENEEINKSAVSLIQKLIKDSGIRVKNVNIIIPNSVTYTQLLSMPFLSEKELISAIKYQADRFIPLPIEETNIDLEIIEENKNQKTILALIVAAQKKTIEKVQEICEEAGLIPESIENETSAVARFFTELKLANLVIDFNYDNTTFYFFDTQNFILKEIYNFKIGYYHFIKEIQFNTTLKFEKCENLLKEFAFNSKNTIEILQFITPLIDELFLEFKKFYTLITGKYNEKIDKAVIFNNTVNFPSLADLLNQKLPNFFTHLNFFNKIKENEIFKINNHHLQFFVAAIGGNLQT